MKVDKDFAASDNAMPTSVPRTRNVSVAREEAQDDVWATEACPLDGLPPELLAKIDATIVAHLRERRGMRERIAHLKSRVLMQQVELAARMRVIERMEKDCAQFVKESNTWRKKFMDQAAEVEGLKDEVIRLRLMRGK